MNLIIQRIIISLAICLAILFVIGNTLRLSMILEFHSPNTDDVYQIFYDIGSGFSEKDSVKKYIWKTNHFMTLSFKLPNEQISHFRIDLGTNKTFLFIKSISLRGIFSEHRWNSEDIIRQFKPAEQIGKFAKYENLVMIETLGTDPYLVTILPVNEITGKLSHEIKLYRLILSIFTCFISICFYLSHISTALTLKLIAFFNKQNVIPLHQSQHIAIPFLLLFIAGLILSMSVISGYSTHPDEYLHINSAKYFFSRWLPPELGHPETLDSYSKYGFSYLNELDIVYFIAAKFSLLFKDLIGNHYIALRFFNFFLFLVLTILSVRVPQQDRLFFFPLLLTPQVWYVFSYFNGDAFPLFLSIILIYQLINPESVFSKYTFSNSLGCFMTGGLFFAILMGVLLISKRNYYISILFILFFMAWNIKKTHKDSRRNIFMKYAFVVLLAFSMLTIRYVFDIAINGFDKGAKVLAYAEKNAIPSYKLSTVGTQASFIGLKMKEKGISYYEFFSKFRWHEKSFRSFFGVYGWMTIYGSLDYYRMVRILLFIFLLFLIGSVFTKSDKENRIFFIFIILFALGTIFISTYHSWVNDFQPQGRYLFPIIGMLAALMYKNKEYFNNLLIYFFIYAFFLVSTYSFVFTGLARIPK